MSGLPKALSLLSLLSTAAAVVDDTVEQRLNHRDAAPLNKAATSNKKTYIVTFVDNTVSPTERCEALALSMGGFVDHVYDQVLNGCSLTFPAAQAQAQDTFTALGINAAVTAVEEDQIVYAYEPQTWHHVRGRDAAPAKFHSHGTHAAHAQFQGHGHDAALAKLHGLGHDASLAKLHGLGHDAVLAKYRGRGHDAALAEYHAHGRGPALAEYHSHGRDPVSAKYLGSGHDAALAKYLDRGHHAEDAKNHGHGRSQEAAANSQAVTVSSWGLDRIDQCTLPLDGQTTKQDASGVRVFILDTGILSNHEEFANGVISSDDCHYSAILGKTALSDENGHG